MSGIGNYNILGQDGGKKELRSLFPQIMSPCEGGAGAQISKRKKSIFTKYGPEGEGGVTNGPWLGDIEGDLVRKPRQV